MTLRTFSLLVLLSLCAPAVAQRAHPAPPPGGSAPPADSQDGSDEPSMDSHGGLTSTSSAEKQTSATLSALAQSPDRYLGQAVAATDLEIREVSKKDRDDGSTVYEVTLRDTRTNKLYATAAKGATFGVQIVSPSVGGQALKAFQQYRGDRARIFLRVTQTDAEARAYGAPPYLGVIERIEWLDASGAIAAAAY